MRATFEILARERVGASRAVRDAIERETRFVSERVSTRWQCGLLARRGSDGDAGQGKNLVMFEQRCITTEHRSYVP
jgi:hypothetical protein